MTNRLEPLEDIVGDLFVDRHEELDLLWAWATSIPHRLGNSFTLSEATQPRLRKPCDKPGCCLVTVNSSTPWQSWSTFSVCQSSFPDNK